MVPVAPSQEGDTAVPTLADARSSATMKVTAPAVLLSALP